MYYSKRSKETNRLIDWLDAYQNYKTDVELLNRSLKEIKADFEAGALKASKQDGMPKGNKLSEGAAEYTLAVESVKESIKTQKQKAIMHLAAIEEAINLLPLDSREYLILTARFILGMSMDQAAESAFMSRNCAYKYFNLGIKKLMSHEKIKQLIMNTKVK